LKKSTPAPTSGPKLDAIPRSEQDFRAKWGSYRCSETLKKESCDFSNRLAHYWPHHAARQIAIQGLLIAAEQDLKRFLRRTAGDSEMALPQAPQGVSAAFK
jgi:hypothetical protein